MMEIRDAAGNILEEGQEVALVIGSVMTGKIAKIQNGGLIAGGMETPGAVIVHVQANFFFKPQAGVVQIAQIVRIRTPQQDDEEKKPGRVN